jgi:site-specific DNA-adenine methylase
MDKFPLQKCQMSLIKNPSAIDPFCGAGSLFLGLFSGFAATPLVIKGLFF